nr:NAD(P)H-dependent oxidoreductase [Photobacterium obscurum]
MPAKLKGLIDRTFLPGFAFKYSRNKSIPEKLLKGRSAELILAMDTPPFYYRWIQGNPVYKQLKHTILKFCGFDKVTATYIGPVISATDSQKNKWFENVERLAAIHAR